IDPDGTTRPPGGFACDGIGTATLQLEPVILVGLHAKGDADEGNNDLDAHVVEHLGDDRGPGSLDRALYLPGGSVAGGGATTDDAIHEPLRASDCQS
ncbi:MAG TPA: hypothetical protein VGR16_11755, partial [Thermomicrobiales bacterium]|nr:hypothetical protein [Thermomicrobiales bacterium]